MKKRFLCTFLILCLLGCLHATAYADHYNGSGGWTVTFTKEGRIESNFKSSQVADAASGLQPGDEIALEITLNNQSSGDVDWYMLNKVLKSMEDGSAASGGAYSYRLRYRSVAGSEKTLYDSDTVGGEQPAAGSEGQGLHEATSAMADYFYLDTMGAGKSGTVTLQVALDGETQGNSYQNTLADLQLHFAAELRTSTVKTNVVKTGDETNLLPYYIAMAVSGGVFLLLAVSGIRQRKREERKSA